MSRTDGDSDPADGDAAPDRTVPRAVIHKRILDAADRRPDASLDAIAEEVGGATADLVDDVLAEYGDPGSPEDGSSGSADAGSDEGSGGSDAADGAEDAGAGDGTDDPGGADTPEPPAPSDLGERRRATLRAVHETPGASQGDLADRLGVSRATVSRRLNAIPGFEWADRAAVAERVFGDTPAAPDTARTASADGGTTQYGGVDEADGAADPPDAPERQERRDPRESQESVALPADLAHKVIHACVESDRLDEEEELRVIRAVVGSGRHH